jgi:hypothetical protein
MQIGDIVYYRLEGGGIRYLPVKVKRIGPKRVTVQGDPPWDYIRLVKPENLIDETYNDPPSKERKIQVIFDLTHISDKDRTREEILAHMQTWAYRLQADWATLSNSYRIKNFNVKVS